MINLYHEYPNLKYGEQYNLKIYYNIFKKYPQIQNNAYMTCVTKGIPSIQQFEEIFSLFNQRNLFLTVDERYQYLLFRDILQKPNMKNILKKYKKKIIPLINCIDNFHQIFNTYIYYHLDYWDPFPRLFQECKFYDKKIIYINHQNIQDGSYYRMQNHKDNHALDTTDTIYQKIQNKKINILYTSNSFNGSTSNVLEYFLFLKNQKQNVKLYFIVLGIEFFIQKKETLLKHIKDKYLVNINDIQKDIIFIKVKQTIWSDKLFLYPIDKELIANIIDTECLIFDHETIQYLSQLIDITKNNLHIIIEPQVNEKNQLDFSKYFSYMGVVRY